MFKLDSLHKLYQIQGDSLMKLHDIFRIQADSLEGLHFMMPGMEGKQFRFHFPEDGLRFEGLEGFEMPKLKALISALNRLMSKACIQGLKILL